jgi:hypothetical protein
MIRAFLSAVLGASLLAGAVGTALAGDVYVRGYTNRNGTYIQPHYRSAPDSNPNNNWSTRGNINPHTGEVGTREPRVGTPGGLGSYGGGLSGNPYGGLSGNLYGR